MNNAIRIDYQGMRPYLQEAVVIVNSLLRSEEFYDNIAAWHGFDLADTDPKHIAKLIRDANIDMCVDLYYAMSPFKNIDGYDDLENPSTIHVNIWKLDRPIASLCNTLVHGCVHAVNAHNDNYYFGHGNMYSKGKENTAPYWIGAMAQRMISNDESTFVPLEHDILRSDRKPIKDYLQFD